MNKQTTKADLEATAKRTEVEVTKYRKEKAGEVSKVFVTHAETLEKFGFDTEARAVRRVISRLDAFTKGLNYIEERRKRLAERRST